MTLAKLTNLAFRAHMPRMAEGNSRAKRRGMVMVMLGAIPVSGCITLEAPDEPIVIELNINITQEVIYRLADDAGDALDQNSDIF